LTLAREYALQLAIVHVNHSLRGQDSDRDAEFAASVARQLDLPFHCQKIDVKAFRRKQNLSLEEAARKIRYESCESVAAKFDYEKIALGHHSEDNAELVLMNLLRGSGPLGLSGIAPVRGDKIIRPLICLKRSDILDYLAVSNLQYVTDASNTDTKFLRNKIRHQLMPELKNSYNPKIIETLNRLGSIMRAENQWFNNAITPAFERCVTLKTSDTINLGITAFKELGQAVKRRIIRKAILSIKKDLRRITLLHVDAVLDLANRGPATGRLSLPGGILVKRNASDLIIVWDKKGRDIRHNKSSVSHTDDYQYTIFGAGILPLTNVKLSISFEEIGIADLPDFKFTASHLAFFDMDCIRFPLIVRNIRPGDRFSPLGVPGTQKIKKYFIDKKIPAAQRKKCPLVLSKGRIIWIAGHRIDNSVKVGPQTRRVLRAELLLA
jgi:tRNA(Ile)-lysidine synthase